MEFLNFLTVWGAEVAYLLYKTGNFMLDATIRPYVATAVCEELYGPGGVCSSPSFKSQHKDIQDRSSSYLTYYRLILYLPAAFLGFFWGAWSDRSGRKLPMIFPNVGGVLGVLCYLLISLFPQHTLVLLLLGTTVQGVCCTSHVVKMASTAYVVENTGLEDVTRRLSILMSMHFLGMFLGSMLAGLLQDLTNIQLTLLVASVFHACTVVIVVCCIKDKDISETDQTESAFKASLSGIQDSLQLLTKQRPGNSRCLIICLCIASSLQSLCYVGDFDISMFYTQGPPLEWPESWYGYYLALDQVLRFIGLMFIQPFLSSTLKVREISILLLSIVLGVVRSVWSSFSVVPWMMWTSACFGVLGGINYSIIRSLLSREIELSEIGKMFALIESIDMFTRPFGSAVFIAVYSKSNIYFPGMAYQTEGVVYLVFLILMIFFKMKA